MPELRGTVIIAQEGRLHVIDDAGAGHLFILSPHAAAETQQLAPLQARQARVAVRFSRAPGVIGLVAERIELLESFPVRMNGERLRIFSTGALPRRQTGPTLAGSALAPEGSA
jgi:hypothetical protein